MGLVIRRCLRKGGVSYLGLRWDSTAFSRLRARLPNNADVSVRIDPRNLDRAYVWNDGTNKWVEGRLKSPTIAASYSLDQWHFIDFNRKENIKIHRMSKQAAIDKAIADINRFIDGIREGYQSSKAYKRYLEYISAGRPAWENLAQPIHDPSESGEVRGHVLLDGVNPGTYAQTGPYRNDYPALVPAMSGDENADDANSETGNIPPHAVASVGVTALPTAPSRSADPDDDDFEEDVFSTSFAVGVRPTHEEN